MASILYRVAAKNGYTLKTLKPVGRGVSRSFKPPAEQVLHYYVRYNNPDPSKKGRIVKPVEGGFAEAIVDRLNAESMERAVSNGQSPAVAAEIMPNSERLTVAEAVSQWLATFPGRLAQYHGKADNGLSEASIASYTKTAKDFLAYCNQVGVVFMPKTDRNGQQDPNEVNAGMLLAYETYLREKLPVKHNQAGEAKDRQGTIVARFRNLGVFFAHFDLLICERPKAHDGRGILKAGKMPRVNKAKKLREAKARQKESVIIYSDEEINAMLAAANEDETDLIKFLVQTGVRDKEAAHSEWSDIDWKAGKLKLQDKLRWEWRLKDKETRSLNLNPKMLARLKARKVRQEKVALAEGQDAPTLIFPNSLNNPDLALDERIQKVVAKAKKAGTKWDPKSEVTMHKFRKTFATLMHRAGCDLTTVRDLLGHSDISTTELYIASDTDRAAEVGKIAFHAFGD